MNVLIFNPPKVDGFSVVREERFEHKDIGSVYPPLGLLYVAAVLEKENINVSVIDANGFNLNSNEILKQAKDISPDVIITRIAFDTQKQDMHSISELKKATNAKVIGRNKIISDVEELKIKLLKEGTIDIFLNEEPESVIANVIKNINNKDLKKIKGISYVENGSVISTEKAPLIDINSLPFPAYHLLPNLLPYHTGIMGPVFATVLTSRGCPFKCSFCAYSRAAYRTREPESVVEELLWLKNKFGLKNFLFFDDLVSLKEGHMERICELMLEKKLNLKWVCCTRANRVNREMLQLMKKAGCKEIAIGIESGSEKILKMVDKGVTLDDIRNCARLCRETGILFYAMTIVGLPEEDKNTIKETISFIREINPFYTQFCFSTPFPNTAIYKYYKENNLLLTEDWEKYFPLSNEPVVRTKALTREDLISLRKTAYRRTLLRPSYLISKVSLTNWKWNLQGISKIASRVLSILRGKAIR